MESKRYEPFRDAKQVSLPPAYDRRVWGNNMLRFGAVRDVLRSGELRFRYLDAAQLLKHAYAVPVVHAWRVIDVKDARAIAPQTLQAKANHQLISSRGVLLAAEEAARALGLTTTPVANACGG